MKPSDIKQSVVMRYQTIWQVPSQRVIGYEATVLGKQGEGAAELFRKHAKHRVDFDCMLIELALNEGQQLLQQGQLLFINVHPDTLHAGCLPACPPNTVYEITERSKFTSQTKSYLRALRQQGVQLAMDDFGKRFSNLDRLMQYWDDFGVVKLDRCFVEALTQPHTQVLIEALVAFCKQANIMVIAEGVETQEQYMQLIKCGITYMQGYYLGYPTSLQDYKGKEVVG